MQGDIEKDISGHTEIFDDIPGNFTIEDLITRLKIRFYDNEDLKQSKILDNALIRENFQRNFVQNELKKIDEEDLILVNDLDEIPNLEKFKYNVSKMSSKIGMERTALYRKLKTLNITMEL